jgi:uncharacterized protein
LALTSTGANAPAISEYNGAASRMRHLDTWEACMNSRRIAYLTLAFACLSFIADAQGLNCNNARLPDEVLICQSPVLSRLDQRMASIYVTQRNRIHGVARRELEADQSDWLRRRMECGRDYYCIERAYQRRIPQLVVW